jgi:hypothetical protein
MADYVDTTFIADENSPGLFLAELREGEMFDFATASDDLGWDGYQDVSTVGVDGFGPAVAAENRGYYAASTIRGDQPDSVAPTEADHSDIPSDDDDGLYDESASSLSKDVDDELDHEDDAGLAGDDGSTWKIKHSSGDHKLKGTAPFAASVTSS